LFFYSVGLEHDGLSEAKIYQMLKYILNCIYNFPLCNVFHGQKSKNDLKASDKRAANNLVLLTALICESQITTEHRSYTI
jgi:hypothetical protein